MTMSYPSETELLALATSALAGFGMSKDAAAAAARILVYADMFGIHTHGVERILSYGERLRIGGIKADADITATAMTPSIISVDGDNGLGPLVGRGRWKGDESARTNGLALALVKANNHFGRSAPTATLPHRRIRHLIGSNATTTIAPWGGSEANSATTLLVSAFLTRMVILYARHGHERRRKSENTQRHEGWRPHTRKLGHRP